MVQGSTYAKFGWLILSGSRVVMGKVLAAMVRWGWLFVAVDNLGRYVEMDDGQEYPTFKVVVGMLKFLVLRGAPHKTIVRKNELDFDSACVSQFGL